MPGVDDPYKANTPQSFTQLDADNNWFVAKTLPLSDIDDKGRVNANALFRIEASQSQGQVSAAAKTDAVLSSGRDFHCRECHAKGQIAANPNAGYKKEGFGLTLKSAFEPSIYYPTRLDKPAFFSVADIGGNPDNLFDQEYAAALNYSSIHDFYDLQSILPSMQKGWGGAVAPDLSLLMGDGALACNICHGTSPTNIQLGFSDYLGNDWDTTGTYVPGYSTSMHRFHGELQYNADKSDIVRNDRGAYQRWDWKTKGSNNKEGVSLFPIFDANGKQLPMEQNCLKCHAGHREPMYNDRMKTAGVTCYDCHGDMLAVSRAFPKSLAKLGSFDPADYRIPWFDETDCGSCHTGTGKAGDDSFFSAGVRKTAFDPADASATTRKVDKIDPDASRFAVVPDYETSYTDASGSHMHEEGEEPPVIKVSIPVYRHGKDQHGAVACAACHGAAHSVGPNRDPKANDNVTAIQLQGYPGQIYECNVCHTKDAFKDMMNSGSTLHYPNKDGSATVLAGPHNLHPVNDPYWWKQAPGDSVDSTPGKPKQKGGIKGGWHNDWAKLKGSNDEDQCAACHGTDHKGTRLSKVPVDRELITEKGKKLLVKAGTPIGCDLCHSIEKSCTGSPAGSMCGTIYTIEPPVKPVDPGNVNPHAPVITSKSLTKGLNVGEQYSYQVTATQVDNLALTYSLVTPPDGMMIDPTSHLITWTAQAVSGDKASFKVKVTNSANEETLQAVSISVCVAPKQWSENHGHCM